MCAFRYLSAGIRYGCVCMYEVVYVNSRSEMIIMTVEITRGRWLQTSDVGFACLCVLPAWHPLWTFVTVTGQ